ncbi:unnamed protein product [Adineta ricciae]|uniref:Protein kinase domain-containing protein n=1 Tax=Adineta ricciae TaxID=249248 RepID=A0A815EAC8_ADIRI|nr:unnamed protein product [Adineta ricciae]
MGNRLANSNFSAKPIPPEDLWLQNQTFRVRQQLYTLLDRCGGGAFGSVWASSTPQGHRAAVKVFDLNRLRPGMNVNRLVQSFQDEVQMIYRMRGAERYVVHVYGFDFDAQRRVALLAMELGGESLQDRATNLYQSSLKSPMIGDDFIPARERKHFWIQLVNIILVLHHYNIVHRDLKPANFVFFGPLLKVIDLGIAQKEISRYGVGQNLIGGTRFYSGPECLSGQYPVTSKADIWSLGAILYFLTYGTPPLLESFYPPPNIPPTRSSLVKNLLHACLQRNPSRRPTHQWLAQHPFTVGPAVV